MPKGFFTQGLMVLLDAPLEMASATRLLPNVIDEHKTNVNASWFTGDHTLMIPFRTEVNGYIAVDQVTKPWPDDMGDPKTNLDVFGAWSMGAFGPFTFPGSLGRATKQSWGEPKAKELVSRHRAFLRIRMSYVFGAADSDPVRPADYAPVAELDAITDVVVRLLDLPQALCYFNPSGETILTLDRIRPIREHYKKIGAPPLDLWCNVRMWNFDDGSNWMLFDSVGMEQLDLPDHEACYRRGRYKADEVAIAIRNSTLYIAQHGPIIKDGETMEGAGGIRWRAKHHNESIVAPPRPVLRWLPMDDSKPPARLRQTK